jgi:SnoaL-like protein
MSPENVEIVRLFSIGSGGFENQVEAWASGDLTRWFEAFAKQHFHADFEFELVGSPDQIGVDLAGPHKGPAGALQIWGRWLSPWKSLRIEYEEPVDAGERVLLLGRQYATAKTSDVEIQQPSAGAFTFLDGAVRKMDGYLRMEDALEAVGLSE